MTATISKYRRSQVIASFATTALVLSLSLGTSVILARALGPDDRGLLFALTFWPALLSGLFNLSLNESTAYHVARHSTSSDAAAFASTALWSTILVALVATVMATLVLPLIIPAAYKEHLRLITIYAAAFVPLSMLDLSFRAVLQGRGAIMMLNVVRAVQPIGYFVLLVMCSLVGPLDVTTVMAAMIATLAMSALSGASFARVRYTVFGPASIQPFLRTGWRFHQANVLFYGAAELDKLIVLLFLSTTQAGLYAVAIAISAIGTGVVLQSLGLMLVRDMASSEGAAGRRKTFVASMRTAFGVLIGFNAVAALLANWWVPLLFGSAFSGAVPATIVLLAMGTFKGARQMVDRALRAMHHTRTGMVSEIVALGAIAVLGPIGAAAADLNGVAAGVTIAECLALAVTLSLSKRQLGVSLIELWPIRRAALADAREFITERKLPPAVP